MTKFDQQIQQAAHVLLEHHGANAVVVAGEWVEAVTQRGDRRDLDVAYRVLSAVERIAGEQTAAE